MNKLYFQGPNPTCDLVIQNHEGSILLIQRGEKVDACPGQWALPGGFIDTISKKGERWVDGTETAKQAAVRELQEETNLSLPEDIQINFVGKFEGNNRDPRDTADGWTVSHSFYCALPQEIFEKEKDNIRGMDDASNAKWFSVQEISNLDIAFDHKHILELALELYPDCSVQNTNKATLNKTKP